jgi:hypothetical protein
MLRPVLLALAGVAVAAVLSLVVFFASEAALGGGDQSPLAPREPAPAATTERVTKTGPDVTASTPTGTVDDHGRGRGRGRGRGGGSDDD